MKNIKSSLEAVRHRNNYIVEIDHPVKVYFLTGRVYTYVLTTRLAACTDTCIVLQKYDKSLCRRTFIPTQLAGEKLPINILHFIKSSCFFLTPPCPRPILASKYLYQTVCSFNVGGYLFSFTLSYSDLMLLWKSSVNDDPIVSAVFLSLYSR